MLLVAGAQLSFTCPEQFSKYANLFFLFTALIQQIPDVSPTNPYTTILPLGFVLLASAFKETQEDLVSLLFYVPIHAPKIWEWLKSKLVIYFRPR